jgi:hypothetical protein
MRKITFSRKGERYFQDKDGLDAIGYKESHYFGVLGGVTTTKIHGERKGFILKTVTSFLYISFIIM